MSRLRIYPQKENTIFSGAGLENINTSQAKSFDLVYGGGSDSTLFGEQNIISRHLMYFDLTDLQSKINDNTINSATTSCFLNCINAIPMDSVTRTRSNSEIASSFDLIIFAISANTSSSFDEGLGDEYGSDIILTNQNISPVLTGYSNWNNYTNGGTWINPGVYSAITNQTSNYSVQHFSTGSENLNVDITPMVMSWLSGETTNLGVGIAYISSLESLSSNTKSVSSFFTNKINTWQKPYIECVSSQEIYDDRNSVNFSRPANLFLYLFSGNSTINYFNAGTVSILDNNNAVIQSDLIINQLTKGVYYINLILPKNAGAIIGQKYKDIWYGIDLGDGAGTQDFTQTFIVKPSNLINSAKINDYVVDIYGLSNNSIIQSDETYRISANIRTNFSTQPPNSKVVLQYQLMMGEINVVIPWTNMNYVIMNNYPNYYFDLDTSWLLDSQNYKILFKINEFGTQRILSDVLEFRVINSPSYMTNVSSSIFIPTLTTTTITANSGSTANSGGNITSDGSIILQRGIVWNTASTPTIFINLGMTNNGSGIGNYLSTMTGLTNVPQAQAYFVRAYATNNAGTAYGNQLIFKF
jgi:hypothetical protein